MKNTTLTIGRMLFALPFLIFGIMHFMMAEAMTAVVPSFMPAKTFWVYLTGLALIAAAISVIIQKQVKLTGILLAIMLVIFILTIHLPMVMSGDAAMMQMAMPSLLKDMALAGGGLILSGMYQNEN